MFLLKRDLYRSHEKGQNKSDYFVLFHDFYTNHALIQAYAYVNGDFI